MTFADEMTHGDRVHPERPTSVVQTGQGQPEKCNSASIDLHLGKIPSPKTPMLQTSPHPLSLVLAILMATAFAACGPSNNGAPPLVEDCDGCVSDGECVEGDGDDACGGGGDQCVACTGDEVCADGACEAPPGCTPDSCDGCCDGDTCVDDATTNDACGSGGNACQACEGEAQCSGGRCVTPCGPQTCEGCCNADGTCVAGNADELCGGGGSTCIACDAGTTCSGGQCIGTSCATDCDGCCSGPTCLGGNSSSACGLDGIACVDCGAQRICEAGACVVDPDSRWDIVVVNAELSEKNAEDATWDQFGGLPDPYPAATAGADDMITGELSSVSDTLSPSFTDPVLTRVRAEDLEAGLKLFIWDSDLDFDDLVTGCPVDTTDTARLFSGMVLTLECPASEIDGTNTTEGTIRFRVEPG